MRLVNIFRALACLVLAWPFALFAATSGDGFARFSVELPAGWGGDEQTGFVSDDPDEYQLTFTRPDEAGDEILGQVSIYMLPNKPGTNARETAARLAEAQGGSSEPKEENGMWVFRGEPRTRAMRGEAITMVNANPQRLLIIIAQDPKNLGSRQIIDSLRAKTPEARELLGR